MHCAYTVPRAIAIAIDLSAAEPAVRLVTLLADMRAAGTPLKRIRRELELALEDLKR